MNGVPPLKGLRTREYVSLADRAMVGALAVALCLLVALYHGFALDDSFITYRYAENLASGEGFAYNPGQRSLATTAPFYAILLTLIRWLVPLELPLAANLFSLLSLAGGGGVLYLLARRHGHPSAGMCAALLYTTSPLLLTSTGMETSFCLLLVLLAALAFDGNQSVCSGLFLGLAIVTRLDTVLLAAILGLMYLWRYRALPWRAIAVAALVIGPFFLALALYFGSPLPGSLAAKQAQMVLGFPSYGHGLLRYLAGARVGLEEPQLGFHPFLLITLLATGGMIVSWGWVRRSKHTVPSLSEGGAWWLWGLVAWGVLHAAAYLALGVPAYHWYYAPLEPGLYLLVGLCLEPGLAARRHWRWAVAVLVVGVVAANIAVAMRAKRESFDPKARTYRAVGEWLAAHAQPQDRVAVMEVGLVGYHSRLPMIDLLGLIDPPARRALVRRDVLWPIAHYHPEYVVLSSYNPFYSVHLEQGAWFYDWYRPVHSQPDEEWGAAPINTHARRRPLVQPVVQNRVVAQGRLGDFRLLAYDLSTERAQAREWVELSLYWRREGPSAPHLRVFSHVIDDQFSIYGAHDLDIYPRRWGRGEVVSTHHFLCVTSNLPPGRYHIEVGLYHPDTLQRLPALDEEGAATGAEIIVLQEIQVDS